MNRTVALKVCLSVCVMAFMLIGSATHSYAGMLDTGGRFKVDLSGAVGFGLDDITVGTTTSGEDVTISGGGGYGVAIGAGYGLSSTLDIELTAGVQESVFEPEVANADGTFSRSLLLLTMKYKIPLSEIAQLKFGGGIGSYGSGEMDNDLSSVPGGDHVIIQYDDALGIHLTGEVEAVFQNSWSVAAGARYYNVTYDASSVTVNGSAVPVSLLTDQARELDGTGFDIIVSLAKYF